MSVTTNNTETAVVEEVKMSNKKEQLGHAIGVLGHDSACSLLGTWMVPFLTDIVQIPALALGFLLGFGRIFDGVNDLFMGSIADKTKSRWGRFRPWILRAGPLYCLCVALSFIIPSDNMVIRIIYASVMYVAADITFTAVDIPFWSLPAAMTSNTTERSGIIGTTMATSSAANAIIGIIMPLALVYFGGASDWSAYFKSASLVAAFAAVTYVICFKMVKEHVLPDPSQKYSLKTGVKCVFTNKPLLCIQIINAVSLLAIILKGNFGFFYAKYNLGDVAIMALRSAVGLVFAIIGSLMFSFLAKHISKKNLLIMLIATFSGAGVVFYFVGWGSIPFILCYDAVSTFCTSGIMVAVNAMLADTIEYGEWKTGQRSEGMITSTRCFVTKLVAAVSGVVVAFVIGTSGYIPNVDQSISTLNSFHFILTIGCSAVMLICVLPVLFYTLTEKRHAEILVELAQRKADK